MIGQRAFLLRHPIAVAIALAVTAFAVLRLPFVLYAGGQMDEQWFAVPGYTVWTEGIPRIPYCPTRIRENFFENADVCLFALPPALHYVQAPFFGLFPAGYPTARLPSFLGGIIGLIVLGNLTRRAYPYAIWTIGLLLFAISRPVMFTAITARPDLLCCVCGWAAILCIWRFAERQPSHEDSSATAADSSKAWEWEFWVAGALCGLGLLFHPFALVACLQCGVWTIAMRGSPWRRLRRGIVLTLATLLVLCLWLPLILRFPYEFESQFTSNVLSRSGPGILQRLAWPWPYLLHHARYQWEFNQPFQFGFLTAGCVLGAGFGITRFGTGIANASTQHCVTGMQSSVTGMPRSGASQASRWTLLLVGSGIYLTAALAGIHPTKGYWLYPIGLMYPLAVSGWMTFAQQLLRSVRIDAPKRTAIVATVVMIAVMMPGAGITTWLAYVRDGGSSRTNASRFIRGVLDSLPSDRTYLVDVNYVFDVWLTGRTTLLCQPRRRFWGDRYPSFDFMLIDREGTDAQAPEDYNARLLREEGTSSTAADCRVLIYVPNASPSEAAN